MVAGAVLLALALVGMALAFWTLTTDAELSNIFVCSNASDLRCPDDFWRGRDSFPHVTAAVLLTVSWLLCLGAFLVGVWPRRYSRHPGHTS